MKRAEWHERILKWEPAGGLILNTYREKSLFFLSDMLDKAVEMAEFYSDGDWDPVPFEGCQGPAADGGYKAEEFLKAYKKGEM